jgi:hypothetical protein
MIYKLFKAKTWQIFLLLILPGYLASIPGAGSILLIPWGVILAWATYSLGNMLYKKLPAENGMNLKAFNFNLVFSCCYLVFILCTVGGYSIDQDNFKEYGWAAYFIIPLHLYCMYGLFYCIYFIAKSIAMIEQKKPVKFEDYAGNFFLLWFFPVGIWWMHPKVRRIFSEDNTDPIQQAPIQQ